MINKIDSSTIVESVKGALGTPPPKMGNPDFQSILQGKLGDSQPLEKLAIEYLLRAIEAMMPSPLEGSEFSLPYPTQLSPPTQPISPASELLPETTVPKNLHGVQKFESIIEEAAEKNGVDPSLVQAVIQAESSGNPTAVSSAGAQGLMQLMPATAKELGVKDPFDPAENVMAGTRYLRRLMDRYQGNTRLALAAYNWGMGNLENRPHNLPKETKDYIAKVENYYASHLQTSRLA